MLFNQNKNFLLGILATVASVASNANISSAETTLPLKFNNSILEALNASAKTCNSSIINRLLDKSKSFKLESFFITSTNVSATSEESLLLDTWHTRICLFYRTASASLSPAWSSNMLLLIRSSFKFFTLITKSKSESPAWLLISF